MQSINLFITLAMEQSENSQISQMSVRLISVLHSFAPRNLQFLFADI